MKTRRTKPTQNQDKNKENKVQNNFFTGSGSMPERHAHKTNQNCNLMS